MSRFAIECLSHGFLVHVHFLNDRDLVNEYAERLNVYDWRFDYKTRRKIKVLKQSFYTFIPRLNTYGFQLPLLSDFIDFLKRNRIYDKDIEIKKKNSFSGKKTNVKLSNKVNLLDNQVPIADFLLVENATCRVIEALPGTGKTLLSLWTIAKKQKRAVITMGATHISTWVKSVAWIYKNPDELRVVQGKKEFVRLIEDAKNNKITQGIFLITVHTLRDYLSEYERDGKSTYGVEPKELYEVLGVEVVVTDEAHESLSFQFRHNAVTNVPCRIMLSATISSHNTFTNKVYSIIFPNKDRCKADGYVPYIVHKAIFYKLEEPDRVKCMGPEGYSSNLYEEWVLKTKRRKQHYLDMIFRVVNKVFINSFLEGQAMLIFASSVEMCVTIAEYLNAHCQNKNIKIVSFVENDPSEKLYSNNIIVGTLGKISTGKDVKGLIATLSTTALYAKERNIQMMGRLRKIDDLYPGLEPTYYYLVCVDIPSHRTYHSARLKVLTPLVKRIEVLSSNYVV